MKKRVSKVSLALGTIFIVQWFTTGLIHYFLPQVQARGASYILISYLSLYLLGGGLAWIQMRKISKNPPSKRPLSLAKGSVLFAAQFFYLGLVLVGHGISYLALGEAKEGFLDFSSGIQALMVFLLGPVFEEVFFRKLLGDRLLAHNPSLYLLLSSLLFGLAHLPTNKLGLVLACTYSGFIWALVYYHTRSLLATSTFHIAQNFFVGFLTSYLIKAKETLVPFYILALLVLGLLGLAFLFKNRDKICPRLTWKRT